MNTPNQSKHTPGPWKRIQRGDEWKIEGPNGERVMSMTKGVIPMIPDANLLESAPDLLAACEALIAVADATGWGSLGLNTPEIDVTDKVQAIRLAILKAKGEA